MNSKISQTVPRIVAYWTGYESITKLKDLPFNPSVQEIPSYVQNIDVICLAFALIKNGTIQYTCAADETCLCMGTQRNYWTQTEIKAWLKRVRNTYPKTRFVLSIGGWAYNDWSSIQSAEMFADKVVDRIKNDWSIQENGETIYLVQGVDLDYETGDSTPLPSKVSFKDIIQQIATKLSVEVDKETIVSLPYYDGSPWSPSELTGLQDSITFVSTMNYSDGLEDYNTLKNLGYRAVKGFSHSSQDTETVSSIIQNSGLTSAMYWNLSTLGENASSSPPFKYINAMNDALSS